MAKASKITIARPASIAGAQPLGAPEFARMMQEIGPFEPRPRLAIAISGGADSLALCLLAQDWVRERGGAILALTVDHRLRPEAAAEAKQVGAWLRKAGIRHAVLVRRGAKPETDIQAAAREARYALLADRCRKDGVLHLLLGHHRDDQAETFLLRLDRGSGLDGLAGMAPIVEMPAMRVLRPLLAIASDRLRATLAARGQAWIEDPSNRDPRNRRVQIRDDLAAAGQGKAGSGKRLAETAFRLGRARQAIEDQVMALLAGAVQIWPEGYLSLARDAFAAAPMEIGLRALSRCLMTIGGNAYSQRLERLERLYAELRGAGPAKARTLAGCRIEPASSGFVLCRETAAMEDGIAIGGRARELLWDGRFALVLREGKRPLQLRGLGEDGWTQIVGERPGLRDCGIPLAARRALPALWDLDGVVEVPHLSYGRQGIIAASLRVKSVAFRPTHPLSIAGFGFS